MNEKRSFGAIVIGDEILTNRRQDSHLQFLSKLLHDYGYRLSWLRILGDETDVLVKNFKETFSSDSIVFCFGGIGATPDDKTRQSVAAALGEKLVRHPVATRVITEKFNNDAYPQRIKMAEIPEKSTIIPNPVNQIPGFSLNEHYFVPGFPQMAHPMIEWVMQEYYADIKTTQPVTKSFFLHDEIESKWIDFMNEFGTKFTKTKIYSLPHMRHQHSLPASDFRNNFDCGVELGIVGNSDENVDALAYLLNELSNRHIKYTEV